MIESLSYIGFTSPNAAEWSTFGPEILGAELAEPGDDGAVRLRIDDAEWRIAVHPGDRDELAYLGWSVAGPDRLAAAVAELEDVGLEVREADADLLAARRVLGLVWFVDPLGFRHEISWGLTTRPSTFLPGRAISGFVIVDGGVGHAVIFVPDQLQAERFFGDVLGLRISDRIAADGLNLSFLHCNSRHHSLAFVAIPGMVGFHHFMLEVASLDDVGRARNACRAAGVPIMMDLGRHTNDGMTSFYVRTPSGFEIEYGWGGAFVDDATWVAGSNDATSIWGHHPPAGEQPPPPGIIRRVATFAS